MSLNFDTLFGPYQDKTNTIYSYDWVDVDSATGFVAYDGLAATDSTGTKYLLERSTERANLFSTYAGVVDNHRFPNTWLNQGNYTTLTKAIDADFDTSDFKKTRTLRGKAYVKVPIGTWGLAGSGTGYIQAFYFIAKIRKWNGATETEIASVQSATATTSSGDGDIDIKNYMAASVEVPETTLAVGETLRLTIEVWLDIANDTTVGVGLGHDPQNDADVVGGGVGFAAGDSRLVFACPYKIEAIPA
jgi:hypothetical protein